MKPVLFYLGHPAHFHLFKWAIKTLPAESRIVCIKSKDVLVNLLNAEGIEFINVDEKTVTKKERSRLSILTAFGSRISRLSKIIRSTKPGRLIGSAAELAILGKMHGIPSLIFFEDDFTEVKPFAIFSGPFADYLICPSNCNAWKWEYKKAGHHSYHELAYLHPEHFTPDRALASKFFDLSKRNYLVRFSALGAYHDKGVAGISDDLALKLFTVLEQTGQIHVTSERPLPEKFLKYKSNIPPRDMHHALAFANLYIGDSQTMTAEAAVLGTPALRYNDFVGRLSYLEELEHVYGLTKGFKTGNFSSLIDEASSIVSRPDFKEEAMMKRERMLSEKVNFAKVIQKLCECDARDRSEVVRITQLKPGT